jgi:SRSO17 transposase
MCYRLDSVGEVRLRDYFDRLRDYLGNDRQRQSFALYAVGLLGESSRKSLEPIAAQLCPDPAKVDAMHQRLQHFLVDAPWSDQLVRREAVRYTLQAMTQGHSVDAWIVDDTGFVKQGKHSVGVQRQYTGTVGKVANCQIGVSLTLATANAHLLADMRLYLPEVWADDPEKRKEAHIPDSVQFQTKPELALQMMQQALADEVDKGTVLADSGFGDNSSFRMGVRQMGLDYTVGIHGPTLVVVIGTRGQRSEPISAQNLAQQLGPRAFKSITWREGTKKKLKANFTFRRVIVPQDPTQPLWLIMEWSDGARAPEHFYLSTLPPKTKKKAMVRLFKERYRTEQVYSEAKQELGLDHYEGRRYPGFNHHITAVIACYAFVVAERERLFPPCAPRAAQAPAQSLAA